MEPLAPSERSDGTCMAALVGRCCLAQSLSQGEGPGDKVMLAWLGAKGLLGEAHGMQPLQVLSRVEEDRCSCDARLRLCPSRPPNSHGGNLWRGGGRWAKDLWGVAGGPWGQMPDTVS